MEETMVVSKEQAIHGYKMFESDWTCRDKRYTCPGVFHEDYALLCRQGMHFCQKLEDCLQYYSLNKHRRIAEVRGWGVLRQGMDKCCVTDLEIIREVSWEEAMSLLNTGDCNDGYANTGRYNCGVANAGNENVGNLNSGDVNMGDGNTGDCNYGDNNTGKYNIGYRNVGNYNVGRCNVGTAIIGDFGSGVFCYHPGTNLRMCGFQMFNRSLPNDLPNAWMYINEAEDVADWLLCKLRCRAVRVARLIYEGKVSGENFQDQIKYKPGFWRKLPGAGMHTPVENLPNFDSGILNKICGEYYETALRAELNRFNKKDKRWEA